jgi:anti-anti-sigma factor
MSQITASLQDDGRRRVIRINGRFDFSLHRAFRDAYRDQAPSLSYVVDLSGTEYLDSSALGMLLLLREHAGGDNAKVRLAGASPDVRRLLDIARFAQLFELG